MLNKKSVAGFFDSYAGRFDAIYGNENTFVNSMVNRLFRKSMRLRYIKSLESCDPIEGRRVLDVGCGPGHYSVALAKKGAPEVVGIDFAPSMIDLAKHNSERAGTQNQCKFICGDFMTFPLEGPFEYSIVMGLMDYIAEPRRAIGRILSLTRSRALFSFPASGGALAWQRKLRYKDRCDLFLYGREQIHEILAGAGCRDIKIEKLSRDFFVTADLTC